MSGPWLTLIDQLANKNRKKRTAYDNEIINKALIGTAALQKELNQVCDQIIQGDDSEETAYQLQLLLDAIQVDEKFYKLLQMLPDEAINELCDHLLGQINAKTKNKNKRISSNRNNNKQNGTESNSKRPGSNKK
jgi:hypothetical protein